ncbi:hypothetical protein NVS89_22125 [Ancylobacter sp. MQZ15Z-1]|uniref:Uncharacterized protein n=1 Tax=Ancylobacter mangrovi TaxID=2972472 RepID=A0A9X2PIL9_9HYPH|nr:hypothetical protein [Ancylobacter mangrovi]MCS0497791.1 hypothetical protein [Ancylobacter mangrovi]
MASNDITLRIPEIGIARGDLVPFSMDQIGPTEQAGGPQLLITSESDEAGAFSLRHVRPTFI